MSSNSNTVAASLTLAVILLSLLALRGGAQAGPPPVVGFFVQEGGQLGLTPPTATDSPELALLNPAVVQDPTRAPACAAAANCNLLATEPLALGSPVKLLGDAALVLWLSTDAPQMPLSGLTVRLEKVGPPVAAVVTFSYGAGNGGGTGLAPRAPEDGPLQDTAIFSLTPEPQRITLTSAASLKNLAAGDQIRLAVTAMTGPAAAPGTFNVYLHSDATHPSGVTAFLDGPQGIQLGGVPLGVYMSEAGLTTEYPAGPTASKAITDKVNPTAPVEVALGTTTLPGPVTALGDSLFVLHLQLAPKLLPTEAGSAARPSASVRLSVQVHLDLGDEDRYGSSGVSLVSAPAGTAQTLILSLPTAGLVMPGPVALGLKVFGAANPEAGDVVVLYGSPERATGLIIPVAASAAEAPSETWTPTPREPDPFLDGPTPEEPAPSSPPPEPTPTSEPEPSAAATPAAVTTSRAPVVAPPAPPERAEPAAVTKDVRAGNAPAWGVLAAAFALAVAAALRRNR